MTRRRPLLITAILAAFLVGAAFFMRLGRGPLPLSPSPYLRDVVEPITIVEALSFDDGGSKGVRFRDARGEVRDFCLVSFALDFDDPPRPPELVFGHFYPALGTVAPGGPDERALLGLLQRWAATDPQGVELVLRYDRLERGELSWETFRDGLPDEAFAQVDVVSVLRTLQRRN
ncbi:hypothetical protein [Paludisphaera soli]|uniref:hypothetical protein n=1 Tax=Paludisphaera soli TaxID=2712865 RepID=UPI0013EAF02D|nr:hypothetical protein [Paludisphaera soli]